ncbi:MAG: hypothetical protein IKB05_03585 [Alphaproteobacteria bacterium]|nr:hypothetical protein [Alphaproteobacteria bacterium]
MNTNSSTKRFFACLALPIATTIIMLTGCKNSASDTNDSDRAAFVIDSLLTENRKLTDSLSVVNERLDECNAARCKRCPQDKKKPTPKKPTPKKPTPKKPTQPKSAVAKPASTQVIIDNNNAGNNAVVIGDNNNVNNIVINGCTRVVLDTLAQVKTTRRIMSGHAQIEYTYTK